MTIDILPDDVLLEIFDHYVAEADENDEYEEWQILVHVCQKWRYVVFQSPLRLHLRILCSTGTPVRENLALWPPLPIIIQQYTPPTTDCGEDNIIAALGHNDRVCKIGLALPSLLVESVFAAMQKTFMSLEYLWLGVLDYTAPILPDSFLDGSVPHLRYLGLDHIRFRFPVLRNLLSSATNLVTLCLIDIPHSAYISPEAMVTCLLTLIRLEVLHIEFESPRSRPLRVGRHPPPPPSVLPALTELKFVGVSRYLEDLMARIDAPVLDNLDITFFHFFHQLLFNTPQLVQFISRTPKLKAFDEASVIFFDSRATIALPGTDNPRLQLGISCRRLDWQLSCLAQICTSSFPQALISMLEHLYILDNEHLQPLWRDDSEDNQWLELFHPFTAVKNLYLSREVVPRIASTLQGLIGERVTEVLPNLQSIFMEDLWPSGSVPEVMRQFIATRELSSRPITISHWLRLR